MIINNHSLSTVVTGVNIHIVTSFVCVICIFYTLVVSVTRTKMICKVITQKKNSFKGGIKAVVWTDCIQVFIIIGTMLVIIGKGTMDANGLTNIWDKSWTGGRIVLPELERTNKI